MESQPRFGKNEIVCFRSFRRCPSSSAGACFLGEGRTEFVRDEDVFYEVACRTAQAYEVLDVLRRQE